MTIPNENSVKSDFAAVESKVKTETVKAELTITDIITAIKAETVHFDTPFKRAAAAYVAARSLQHSVISSLISAIKAV